MKAMWGPDPVEFHGRHFRVARSIVGLKPVQRPHPPIYLAGFVAPALRRAATVADGWLPSTLPLAAIAQMLPQLRAFAREAGRDPGRLEVIYMTGAQVTDAPLDEGTRGILCGSAAQIRADVARLREAGVTEVIGWGGGPTLEATLASLERFREAAG
jgi:alkanesulfonate monooxygenase SsuD/methylene tetrahydromethanopterin reductase-like flavin-dependent oxidoreductase (luciferase family)